MNWAIILAAGQSKRMGKIDKVFYQFKGRPLIYYTLKIFDEHPLIKKIIVVVKKTDFSRFFLLIKKYKFRKIAKIVIGGQRRQDSSLNGLMAVKKIGARQGDLILFHNGANPLVSPQEINSVIKAGKKYKAALIAQPLHGAVKEVDKNGFVKKTLPRCNVYLAQTPQIIEYNLAKEVFKKAMGEKFYGVDDVSLVERLKKGIKVVIGDFKNIKVTSQRDLDLVKFFL